MILNRKRVSGFPCCVVVVVDPHPMAKLNPLCLLRCYPCLNGSLDPRCYRDPYRRGACGSHTWSCLQQWCVRRCCHPIYCMPSWLKERRLLESFDDSFMHGRSMYPPLLFLFLFCSFRQLVDSSCAIVSTRTERRDETSTVIQREQEVTWQRAQTSASWERMSESFPFPSSPHWAPRTTVTPLVDIPADFWEAIVGVFVVVVVKSGREGGVQ